MTSPSFAIELKNLSKSFGPVKANSDINLKVLPGTIHGIIGENGAGKSTAMKMLYGLYPPDSGEIFLNGKKQVWHSPKEALTNGIGMVHQHFMLAEPISVLDNVILGNEGSKAFGEIDRAKAKERLLKLCVENNLHIDVDQPVGELSVGQQQQVEIIKLLFHHGEILILDEPTAVLTPQEIESFFEQLKKLRDQGKTILIITHKLKEILSLTDSVTVFRAGRTISEKSTSQTNISELSELMIGSELPSLRSRKTFEGKNKNSLLSVKNLSHLPRLKDISLSLFPGEILGIAGVEGNGQSEFLMSCLQPEQVLPRGEICILDRSTLKDGQVLLNSSQIRSMPVGILPENRQKQGLLMKSNLRDNFFLGHQAKYSKGFLPIIEFKKLHKHCLEAMKLFDVRPQNPLALAEQLSGGNQQKFVVSRELVDQPELIFAAHPTRGVDIGAIHFIHSELIKARDRGAGVLLISSELDELFSLADRILVFYSGKVQAEFLRADFDEKKVGLAMMGGVQ